MTSKVCLARLTSWDGTKGPFGSSTKCATFIQLCKRIPREGLLCDYCKERPLESKYQTRMCHGLLTEPPCEASTIYGSNYYWIRADQYGEPGQSWKLSAHKAQCKAEAHCRAAGFEPWRVQRPTEEEIEDMKGRKKTLALTTKPSGSEPPQKTTLMKHIPVIDTFYEETTKEPEKLPTDSMNIVKKVLKEDEGPVWVTETGLVFAVGSTGEPTKLLRKINPES